MSRVKQGAQPGEGRRDTSRRLLAGLITGTIVAGMLALPGLALANTVTISGTMEGSIRISNGDFVSAGYSFAVSGSHPAMEVKMAAAQITFQGSCSNGGTGSLTVPLSAGPYNLAANDNNWIPTGDEQSPQGFQGSVVANVCGGTGQLDASSGATFSADLQSNVTASQVAVRFHYRDPNAKGKGNFDCTAGTHAADVCGASWSGTANLNPDALPATPKISTSATPTVTLGSPITDNATLSAGNAPTGKITWSVYGPSATPVCTAADFQATFTNTSVSGNNTYSPTSIPTSFTPTVAGTYYWVASYSGDNNNAAVSGNCGDSGEASVVGQAGPKISTSATAMVTLGSPITDNATLSSATANAGGTITWSVYGPSATPVCTAADLQATFTAPVSGNKTYIPTGSPTSFTPTVAGTYYWVASYSGDNNNAAASGNCGDSGEVSVVGKATPTLVTDAVSGTVGQPIHDVAHLTGGSGPSGTITWEVYASGDTTCATPLNAQPSALTASVVAGTSTYSSPNFMPPGAGSYEWVATYSGDASNASVTTACGDPNEVSTVTNNAAPAITLHKVERVGSSGSFSHGPVTGNVGETVDYEMTVTNTGNTTLRLAFTDPQCDRGTLSGATVLSGTYDAGTKTLSAGGELMYTCLHVLAAGDQPYTNTASVVGTPPSGPPVSATDSVRAFATQPGTPGIDVVKLQRVGDSGPFTRDLLTVTEQSGNYVVHTIDYEIQVTNTGDTPLTLSLDDPRCDSGTVHGPSSITGTLNGDVLSPGGQAQYTCSHAYVEGDSATFTNVATVTGTPPNGPPVQGTSHVTVQRQTVFPKTKLCRTPSGRVIHYKGHKKPAACKFHPKPPKHPRGFTG